MQTRGGGSDQSHLLTGCRVTRAECRPLACFSTCGGGLQCENWCGEEPVLGRRSQQSRSVLTGFSCGEEVPSDAGYSASLLADSFLHKQAAHQDEAKSSESMSQQPHFELCGLEGLVLEAHASWEKRAT